MKRIPLRHGQFATVDDQDYERLSQWAWTYNDRYVSRNQKIDGKWVRVYMHKEVLSVPGLMTDHINGDTLDNRRGNLRPATNSQNQANSRTRPNLSGHKGVAWNKRGKGAWQAQLQVKGRTAYIGRFKTIEEAARAYEQEARAYFGEYARVA